MGKTLERRFAMKKKNVIGHMTVPKESVGGWFRRWGILPRFICLVVAVLLWLLVANLLPTKAEAQEFHSSADLFVEEGQ